MWISFERFNWRHIWVKLKQYFCFITWFWSKIIKLNVKEKVESFWNYEHNNIRENFWHKRGNCQLFKNNFSLSSSLRRLFIRPHRRCCYSTKSFDDLYVHVTIIGFSAKCGEKGGSLFTRKVVKAGIRCQEKLLSS